MLLSLIVFGKLCLLRNASATQFVFGKQYSLRSEYLKLWMFAKPYWLQNALGIVSVFVRQCWLKNVLKTERHLWNLLLKVKRFATQYLFETQIVLKSV